MATATQITIAAAVLLTAAVICAIILIRNNIKHHDALARQREDDDVELLHWYARQISTSGRSDYNLFYPTAAQWPGCSDEARLRRLMETLQKRDRSSTDRRYLAFRQVAQAHADHHAALRRDREQEHLRWREEREQEKLRAEQAAEQQRREREGTGSRLFHFHPTTGEPRYGRGWGSYHQIQGTSSSRRRGALHAATHASGKVFYQVGDAPHDDEDALVLMSNDTGTWFDFDDSNLTFVDVHRSETAFPSRSTVVRMKPGQSITLNVNHGRYRQQITFDGDELVTQRLIGDPVQVL